MVNFKDWNLKHLGNMIIVGFVLVILIAMIHMFVSPLLTVLFPAVFVTTLTLTDTLLFLILLRLVVK